MKHSFLTLLFAIGLSLVLKSQIKEIDPMKAEYDKTVELSTLKDLLPGELLESFVAYEEDYFAYQTLNLNKLVWEENKYTASLGIRSERVESVIIYATDKKSMKALTTSTFKFCGNQDKPYKIPSGYQYIWRWQDNYTNYIATLKVYQDKKEAELHIEQEM